MKVAASRTGKKRSYWKQPCQSPWEQDKRRKRGCKEKLCWDEGYAVLHCRRKARGERHLREDIPLSIAELAASPTQHSREVMTSSGWGAEKNASKTPSQCWEEEEEGRNRQREEVGSLRACPAERKCRRSWSVQGAFPRAGSARSHGPDKGIAH